MKTIITILVFLALTPALQAVEKDVWYNAKGKVVKVTRAEKEKERFIPLWEKRELAMAAERAARRDGRVRHSRNHNYYVYPGYGSYGYGHYYGYGGYYGGYHKPHYGGHYHGGHHSSPWRFSGVYHGKGWSVRLKY